MACRLAALLSVKEELSPLDQPAVNRLLVCGEMALKPLAADTPHQAMQHKRQTKPNSNVLYERYPIFRHLYLRNLMNSWQNILCAFYSDAQPVRISLHPTKSITAEKLFFKFFL